MTGAIRFLVNSACSLASIMLIGAALGDMLSWGIAIGGTVGLGVVSLAVEAWHRTCREANEQKERQVEELEKRVKELESKVKETSYTRR
jgi:hypothetical protein